MSEEQFFPGEVPASVTTAFVLCKSQASGPDLYFRKDISYSPPKEIWTAVRSLATPYGHRLLAEAIAKFLDGKPNAQPGVTQLVPVVHRETITPAARAATVVQRRKPLPKPAPTTGVMKYLTSYSGMTGEAKKPEPPRFPYRSERTSADYKKGDR
jgi:hypothetical protein